MVKVAINGFGRIGRMVFRAGYDDPEIEFVAINDLTETKTLAYLLKYDSAHGRFGHSVMGEDSILNVGGKKIKVYAEKDPAELPWKDLDIDVVIESTGFFRTKELASKHLEAGAKKVLLSAPGKGDEPIKTIVKGVNEHEITADDKIISNASCTTNSIAPVIKVLDDNFGIIRGLLTTVHSYTAGQKLVDAPSKDLRRGRSAAVNIVPTTTGAAKAVCEVIPALKGKLDGRAIRVPTQTGSITDFTCELEEDITIEKVHDLMKNVASNELKGVLEFSEEALVSTDIITNPHSSIFDSKLTQLMGGNMLKIFAWYDNEWAYSCRMIDLVKLMK